MTRRRIGTALAVALCALGAAAGVRASIPDGGGVIHGCYSRSGAPGSQPGALRVIHTGLGQTCTLSEGSVSWNQTGPPGPQGPQGQRGPTGPQGLKGSIGPTGPAGSGSVYTDYGAFQSVPAGGAATIASVVLPAGRYTLSGTVNFENGAKPVWPICEYDSTATVHQAGSASAIGEFVQMPVIGDVDVTSDGPTVSLDCSLGLTNDAGMEGALIATRVGAITQAS